MTDFLPIFAAVLGANLLTAMFIWGAVNVSRRENAGERVPNHYFIALVMPLAFCGLAYYAVVY